MYGGMSRVLFRLSISEKNIMIFVCKYKCFGENKCATDTVLVVQSFLVGVFVGGWVGW